MKLEDLGFSAWFQEHNDSELLKSTQTARVISVSRNQYMINNEIGEIPAEVTGKLMFNAESALDYPTVGDWVYAEYFDDNTFAVIQKLYPRRSVLKRKTPGKKVDFQLIAANIDVALIMQSLDHNYNLPRLERYLVMINEAGIEPLVLLSKLDLISTDELNEKLTEVRQRTGQKKIIPFSTMNGIGLNEIKGLLEPCKTYCLLGSSGVGKSTLLNSLIGENILKTRSVRESDSHGRHTTSGRQMLFLENRSMIIDTPGMRKLGNFDIETGLSQTFSEIDKIARQCKFSNCTHEHEKGCAVQKALKDETISRDRYRNYIKMKKEAAYYEMSYLEKRQRDKNFGKMVKNVMKNNKNKA